jgi:predicted XRE-type DNA-binding protein
MIEAMTKKQRREPATFAPATMEKLKEALAIEDGTAPIGRETFANVWDALEDTPGDAAIMTVRSDLMTALIDRVESWTLPQAEAARRLGVTRPRLDELLRGKINKFRTDDLIAMAGNARLAVEIGLTEKQG